MASNEMVHTMGQELFEAQETIKSKDKEIERLRDLLAKSIHRDEILEAENIELRQELAGHQRLREALIGIRDGLIVELKAENWDTANEDWLIDQALNGTTKKKSGEGK